MLVSYVCVCENVEDAVGQVDLQDASCCGGGGEEGGGGTAAKGET
jgi:hypothetical protein